MSRDVLLPYHWRSRRKIRNTSTTIRHLMPRSFSNLATFLPEVAVLIDAQCKLNTALETAKHLVFEYFEETCADEDGNVKMSLIKARLAATKTSRRTSQGLTLMNTALGSTQATNECSVLHYYATQLRSLVVWIPGIPPMTGIVT